MSPRTPNDERNHIVNALYRYAKKRRAVWLPALALQASNIKKCLLDSGGRLQNSSLLDHYKLSVKTFGILLMLIHDPKVTDATFETPAKEKTSRTEDIKRVIELLLNLPAGYELELAAITESLYYDWFSWGKKGSGLYSALWNSLIAINPSREDATRSRADSVFSVNSTDGAYASIVIPSSPAVTITPVPIISPETRVVSLQDQVNKLKNERDALAAGFLALLTLCDRLRDNKSGKDLRTAIRENVKAAGMATKFGEPYDVKKAIVMASKDEDIKNAYDAVRKHVGVLYATPKADKTPSSLESIAGAGAMPER